MRTTLMTLKNKQQGFTLIEMAVVLLIMGLITGSVFGFLAPQMDQKDQQVTIDRQNKIARALSDYAQRLGRLPCPSAVAPYAEMGLPRLYDATTAPHGTCTTEPNRDGLVPWRVLGLVQSDATDGYGNPFTYAVSRELTSNIGGTTYRNYRTTAWMPSGPPNINPPKAILCGQPVSSATQQIEVYNSMTLTNANHVTPIQEDGSVAGGDFQTPDTGPATVNAAQLAYFAYTLVSHGKNGERAYDFSLPTWTSPGRRAPVNPQASDTENSDDDREFVVLTKSDVADNTYFDDIFLWRTQEGLIREMGNDSCARP